MPKITITIQAELDELEAECFHNNMIDEESLQGQADTVKDILREWNFATIDWKIETPFQIPTKILQMMRGR